MAGSSPAMTIRKSLVSGRNRQRCRLHVPAEPDEFLRVLRLAVDDELVMHVRAGAAAAGAEIADLLMRADPLADRDGKAVEMCVARSDAVAVVDLDDLAVIVAIGGKGHRARRGRVDRRVVRRGEIDASM